MVWYNMYFIMALMLAKLLGFCLLGTIVEMTVSSISGVLGIKINYMYANLYFSQTDSILSTIINSQWYMLPLEQQRLILRMLAVAQKPRILRAGTIPVNLDTFVRVIKTVYTVGMILIETVQ